LIAVGAWIVVRNPKITNKELGFTVIAVSVSAAGLFLAAWQNQLAANDSKESALASKESADAAAASLKIEKAPALTLNCTGGTSGKPSLYFPLSYNSTGSVAPSGLPNPPTPHITYYTCVINNGASGISVGNRSLMA
jgi:hypothetical protein